MLRYAKVITSITLLGIVWSLAPELSLACERCFGAGADSATTRAIGASMLVLIVLMGFMGSGIFTFFNKAHRRASEMEKETHSGQTEDLPVNDRT